MYYFAYGSNMNSEQMAYRCPGAVTAGHGILWDYALVERKYADIERRPGAWIHGLLWEISEENLRSLDRYEGCPKIYRRYPADIIFDGHKVRAVVYEMTQAAKRERDGIPYSPEYRKLCSDGAIMNGINDAFKVKEKTEHGINLFFCCLLPFRIFRIFRSKKDSV